MKRALILILIALLPLGLQARGEGEQLGYTVQKIWDNGTYNAFTSLIKFQGQYYICFREGRGHVFDEQGKAEGKIRILRSKNGKKWTSVHLFGMEGKDFRDPKLSISPDGRLCVSIGVSVYVGQKLVDRGPWVCFSTDGTTFTPAQPCTIQDSHLHAGDWAWRTTWQQGVGYAVNYFNNPDGSDHTQLVSTTDGIHYNTLCPLPVPDFPNEATIRFLSDGRMAIMLRRDGGDCMGYWAVAEAPYTQWEWKKMPMRLGGPDFLMLDDERVVAASRCHHIGDWCTTSIYTGQVSTGKFRQRIVLPSGGDTSYAGMLIEGDELWVSYYSGHGSHWPCIYLARIPLRSLE